MQGKSCRMCITTTTSAIELASPSMYDADTHKGSLTVDTTGATQVMMQIVCICKIGCILSMNSHLSCLRMIDHLCHHHAIMPASTDPPFLLSYQWPWDIPLRNIQNLWKEVDDALQTDWNQLTLTWKCKIFCQHWFRVAFARHNGFKMFLLGFRSGLIRRTKKKRKYSNQNLFNLSEVLVYDGRRQISDGLF